MHLLTLPALSPIKCGGEPQKVMYMADDVFKSKSGVGSRTNVIFCTAKSQLFPVPEYSAILDKVVERRGIKSSADYKL
jgi:sulfide:quinone oxidoreductase